MLILQQAYVELDDMVRINLRHETDPTRTIKGWHVREGKILGIIMESPHHKQYVAELVEFFEKYRTSDGLPIGGILFVDGDGVSRRITNSIEYPDELPIQWIE